MGVFPTIFAVLLLRPLPFLARCCALLLAGCWLAWVLGAGHGALEPQSTTLEHSTVLDADAVVHLVASLSSDTAAQACETGCHAHCCQSLWAEPFRLGVPDARHRVPMFEGICLSGAPARRPERPDWLLTI